jgi:hypothetical protein
MRGCQTGSTTSEGVGVTKTEFDRLVDATAAARPRWFQLERDPPVKPGELAVLEQELGIELCEEHRAFLETHGAGQFAFLTVLGLATGTPWSLRSRLSHVPRGFLPFADLETGDLYGIGVSNGQCGGPILLWDHESGALEPTAYAGVYELVVGVGLKA